MGKENRSVFQKFDSAVTLRVRSEWDNQPIARKTRHERLHLLVVYEHVALGLGQLKVEASKPSHPVLALRRGLPSDQEQPGGLPLHRADGGGPGLHLPRERQRAGREYVRGGGGPREGRLRSDSE